MLLRAAAVAFFLAVAGSTAALAQSTLLQAGPWANNHAPMYGDSGNAQPTLLDAGDAGGGTSGVGISELGMQVQGSGAAPFADAGAGPNGENFCDYDGPTDNADGYHYLCLSPNAQGGGLLSYGAQGAASTEPLNVMVNGYTAPVIQGPGTTTVGHIACWNDTTGALLADCTPAGTGTVTQINTGTGLTGGPITTTGTISIANTITASGPIGNATTVPIITYNAQGQLTAVTSAAIAGVAPGGSAGGDLTGTYPSPTVAKVNGVTYGASPSTNTVPVVTGSNTVTYEAVPNSALANSATTVNSQVCTLGASCTVTVPISTGVTGLGTGVATFLATPSSANLRGALTDETGTGAAVFATTPTLVTPVLGAATATSINFGGSTLSTYTEGTTTPTIGSAGGTLTTVSAALTYTRIGRFVNMTVTVTLTDAGSGTGGLIIPLPFTASPAATLACQETASTNVAGVAKIAASGTTAVALKYDGTTLIATGRVITCTGGFSV